MVAKDAMAAAGAPAAGSARSYFEGLGLGVSVLTPAGELLYANKALVDILGYSLDELKVLPAKSLLHPDDVNLDGVLFRRLRRGQLDSYHIQFRLVRKDGSIARVDTSVLGVSHAGQRPAMVVRFLSEVEAGPAAPGPEGADSSPWEAESAEVDPLRQQLAEEISRRNRAERFESAAYLATKAMLGADDMPVLLAEMHRAVQALMPAPGFVAAFWNEGGGRLSYPYLKNGPQHPVPEALLERLARMTLQSDKPLLLNRQMLRAVAGSVGLPSSLDAWLGVRLRGPRGQVQGLVALFGADGLSYAEEDAAVAEVVAQFIGWAVERHLTEAAMRRSEARFRSIFESAALGIVITDLQGRIQDMNLSGQAILGHDLLELFGKPLLQFVHPEDAAAAQSELAILAAGGRESFEADRRLLRKDGAEAWCRQAMTLVRDDGARPWFIIAMLEDITEKKLADDRLMHQAFHDQLTGLPNRTLFMDRLEAAMRRSRRQKDAKVAVLFLDLNRFKVVNDSLGHGAGDMLLQEVGRRLQACLRETDTLARFGGDEFAVLLEGFSDVKETGRVIGRIQQKLRKPYMIDGHEIFAGASIGVVLGAGEYEEAGDVIRDADIAMYRAKESGRPGYAVFDRTMHEQVKGILRTETDLRKALDRGEFELAYQPIVSLQDGRIVGLEALIRWNHPERGMVMPGSFISLAEEAGLIFEIDRWVLAWGCSAMSLWRERYPQAANIFLSVNLSAKYFLKKDAVDDLAAILSLTGFNPRFLKLEITENLILDADEHTRAKLVSFKEMGISLALDDFGTGYSSLGYLRRFPFDELKIERSFVMNMLADPDDLAIVESILGLGRTLSLDVVAEGVETAAHADTLRSLGCDLAQGYHFHRPLTARQVEALLFSKAEAFHGGTP